MSLTQEQLRTFEQGVPHDARTVAINNDIYKYLEKNKIGENHKKDDYAVAFSWHEHIFVITPHPDGFWLQQAEHPDNHSFFPNIDTLKKHLTDENKRQRSMSSPMSTHQSDVALYSHAILRTKGLA